MSVEETMQAVETSMANDDQHNCLLLEVNVTSSHSGNKRKRVITVLMQCCYSVDAVLMQC